MVEFSREHGIHAFVFLSFIFAEALKLIIEALVNFFHSPVPLIMLVHPPEATALFAAVTVLTVQYWWVVFESASFYGDNLGFFVIGVLEAGTFYAIAFFLTGFHRLWSDAAKYDLQVKWVFVAFIGLIFLFMVSDPMKIFLHYKNPNNLEKNKLLIRESLRGVGIFLCLLGALRYHRSAMAVFFLALAVVYTLLSKVLSGEPPAVAHGQ